MAMINDVDYVLQAIRLSALRGTGDPLTPRIVSLDPGFALNPYINAAGLSDIDRWPEIKRALDSPPLERSFLGDFPRDYRRRGQIGDSTPQEDGPSKRGTMGGGGGLQYTQTIMGPGRSGGMGMRVSGRVGDGKRAAATIQGNGPGSRTNSSTRVNNRRPSTPNRKSSTNTRIPKMDEDGFFSPPKLSRAGTSQRPRADSAPAQALLGGVPPLLAPALQSQHLGSSMITAGRGLGGDSILAEVQAPPSEALSMSETSALGTADEDVDTDTDQAGEKDVFEDSQQFGEGEGDHQTIAASPEQDMRGNQGTTATSIADSGIPSASTGVGLTADDPRLGETMVDEGSDVDEEEYEDEEADEEGEGSGLILGRPTDYAPLDRRKSVKRYQDVGEATSSSDEAGHNKNTPTLDFTPIPITTPKPMNTGSALTAALWKHVPHLVSASHPEESDNSTIKNPFASLYTSVAAVASAPGLSLELYFPHSSDPTKPIIGKVRKDASVEEVTGYGLYRYWEEGREPSLAEVDDEIRLSTVGWGLRIVEDDGEVDEDFPPLDRDSQVSKFSYGQFAIVEATDAQIKQNTAKAPHIVRRPSRIIANPTINKAAAAAGARPALSQAPTGISSASVSTLDLPMPGTTMKGSVGLSSTLSKPVLLRVRVTASADVHFTTTISVPSDMYIADLTEVLCKKKRLPLPSSDWVLCLADLTLALPLDRNVASLEGKNDLALVKKQWAMEHGLRIGDRRGGDPSASIFRRQKTEAVVPARFIRGQTDFAQTYKKYTVQRKIAIGRHERVLAIDGDYIHIMPSESRAFFDSMKTTSFHISLVASCKLSGRSGGFKINVWREGGQKRYEFEAENGKQADEMIGTIKQLMKSYHAERSSVQPPPKAAIPSSRR